MKCQFSRMTSLNCINIPTSFLCDLKLMSKETIVGLEKGLVEFHKSLCVKKSTMLCFVSVQGANKPCQRQRQCPDGAGGEQKWPGLSYCRVASSPRARQELRGPVCRNICQDATGVCHWFLKLHKTFFCIPLLCFSIVFLCKLLLDRSIWPLRSRLASFAASRTWRTILKTQRSS